MKKLLPILLLPLFAYSDTFMITGPQSDYDISHGYYYQLLQEALEVTRPEYGDYKIEVYKKPISQGRAIKEILAGRKINIHRMGTSSKREEVLMPIRIPLVKGLLGVRMIITNYQTNKAIREVKTIKDLSKFKACQGSHWPDTEILKRNGLPVFATHSLDGMYKMLNAGRCDYFPRSIIEGEAEYHNSKTRFPFITMNTKVLLQYPFPMYFFTGLKRTDLNERVSKGLLMLTKKNKIFSIMKDHPSTKNAFPLKKWQGHTVIKLVNDDINTRSIEDSKSLWIKINE